MFFDCAVAIDAIEFDGRARLAVEFSIAVIVLLELAIDALHSFFRDGCSSTNGFVELLGIAWRNNFVVRVEEIAFAIALEDGAKDPAMAVKIRELRFVELFIELGAAHLLQELRVRPEAAWRSAFRIAKRDFIFFFFGRIPLLGRIHFLRLVGFFRPWPRVAEVGGLQHSSPDGHGRPCTGWKEWQPVKAWRMGWPDSFLGIVASVVAHWSEISELAAYRPEWSGGAIIGVDDVARGASAGAIIAGLIVCAGEIEERIQEARFLKAEKHGIGAQLGPETAVAEFIVGAAGFLFAVGVPDFALFWPPRSNTRSTLPGCEISQRSSGVSSARMPLTRFLCLGRGMVRMSCGTPSAE